eukprot:jgi/Mesen1/530/ME000104S10627
MDGTSRADGGQERGFKETVEERQERVGSLGWLTESAIMPKKQRLIEGVGASSIVELRAQLFKSQEEAKRSRESTGDGIEAIPRKKAVVGGDGLFSGKNSGVEERANRDKLHLKGVDDGSAVQRALERKSELYGRIARGEVSDEEELEKYSIDFLRKGFLTEEKEEMDAEVREMQRQRLAEPWSQRGDQDPDAAAARATRDEDGSAEGAKSDVGVDWPSQVRSANTGQKQFIREVNEQTIVARERAASLKHQRLTQAQKHREKLRQAFLKKNLEKARLNNKVLKASVCKQKSKVSIDSGASQPD